MVSTNELALLTEELRQAVQRVNEVAEKIYALLHEEKATPEKKQPKLEEVRAVLAEKSRTGHTEAIRELLKKYGADRLSAIDPAHYQALLEEAEVLSNAT
jgi:hypothetical protein